MIEGHDERCLYEAAPILSVLGPEGQAPEIEAVVDTGYAGRHPRFRRMPSSIGSPIAAARTKVSHKVCPKEPR